MSPALAHRYAPGEIADAIIRSDFAAFLREFFPLVSGGARLKWAPYLDLLAGSLADVVFGRTKNLIVNIPPRHLKSICFSGLMPAYFPGHFPDRDVMCVSYGQALAREFAEQTRKVMESARYQELFTTWLLSSRQSWQNLRTQEGGRRRATSLDGTATGFGADLLIFDDPQKAADALSDSVRQSSNERFENTFLSRRNDPLTCPIVVVMQRLHEDDFVGHLLAMKGREWRIVNLPAIAEVDESYLYSTPFGRILFRRKTGAPLNAARMPLEELAVMRSSIGEAAWASQYQQQPAPPGGGLVKLEWFARYAPGDLPERFDRIVQSWDTASKNEEWHDYSVCTTWGEIAGRYYLLHVFRERLLYPDLRPKARDLAQAWSANVVVIEDKASGTQLIQDLQRERFYKVKAANPVRDKHMRMSNQTGPIENGRVHLPVEAPWLAEYQHELRMFPNGKFDDQIDSTSQALDFMTAPQPGEGIRQYYKQSYEAAKKPVVEPGLFRMDGPAGISHLYDIRSQRVLPHEDGYYHVDERTAAGLAMAIGWKRVSDDAPPKTTS